MIILSSRLVGALVNFTLGLLTIPQPVRIVRDDVEALAFLRAHCQEARMRGVLWSGGRVFSAFACETNRPRWQTPYTGGSTSGRLRLLTLAL